MSSASAAARWSRCARSSRAASAASVPVRPPPARQRGLAGALGVLDRRGGRVAALLGLGVPAAQGGERGLRGRERALQILAGPVRRAAVAPCGGQLGVALGQLGPQRLQLGGAGGGGRLGVLGRPGELGELRLRGVARAFQPGHPRSGGAEVVTGGGQRDPGLVVLGRQGLESGGEPVALRLGALRRRHGRRARLLGGGERARELVAGALRDAGGLGAVLARLLGGGDGGAGRVALAHRSLQRGLRLVARPAGAGGDLAGGGAADLGGEPRVACRGRLGPGGVEVPLGGGDGLVVGAGSLGGVGQGGGDGRARLVALARRVRAGAALALEPALRGGQAGLRADAVRRASSRARISEERIVR